MILLPQEMDVPFDLGIVLGEGPLNSYLTPLMSNELHRTTFNFDTVQQPISKQNCIKCDLKRKRTALMRDDNPMWSQYGPIFQQNSTKNSKDSQPSTQLSPYRSSSPCTSCENFDLLFPASSSYLDDDWLENTCNPDEICPNSTSTSSPIHPFSSSLTHTLQYLLSPSEKQTEQTIKKEKSCSDYGSDSNAEDIYNILDEDILAGFGNYAGRDCSSVVNPNSEKTVVIKSEHQTHHHPNFNEGDFVELWNSESGSDEEKMIDVETLDCEVVLPTYSSKSAQVAAIHNYSTNRAFQRQHSATSFVSDDYMHSDISCSPQSSVQSERRGRRLQSHSHVYSHSDPASPAYHPSRSASYRMSHKSNKQNAKLAPANRRNNNANAGKRRFHNEDTSKRAQHNVLERKRRSTLKELFFSLRDAVPSMKGNGKFSKVSILENATTHINCIDTDLQRLDDELDRLKREHAELKFTYSNFSL